MIYLIGVDHVIQHDGCLWPAKVAAIKEFSQYLETMIAEKKISIIAEEFSHDALSMSCATISTAHAVANLVGAVHKFCDPDKREREDHNITTKDQREEFWLQGLVGLFNKNILFLCGDCHLETFQEKLHGHGVPAEILSRGWGANLIPDGAQP